MRAQLYTLHNQEFFQTEQRQSTAFWLPQFKAACLHGPKGTVFFMYFTRRDQSVDRIQVVPKFLLNGGQEAFIRELPMKGYADLTAELGIMMRVRAVQWEEATPGFDPNISRLFLEYTVIH